MSVPKRFDPAAFCSAVERRDADSQLAFYAEYAQVRLMSRERPSDGTSTLVGPQIREWVVARCADHRVTYDVVFRWTESDEVMLTEECTRPDGTSALSASRINLSGDRIAEQTVVVIEDTSDVD